jgi:AraC-like DNA-binding protein
MDFEIKTEGGGDVFIYQDLPAELKRLPKLLAGWFTLKGDWGDASFLYYRGDGFTLAFNDYLITNNTVMMARPALHILELHISLGKPIIGTWDGIAQPSLLEGQFNLSYTPHVNTKVNFKARNVHASYDIHFEKPFLIELASDFPLLAEFLERVEKNEATELFKSNYYCSPDMLATIKFIETNNYSVAAQKRLSEYKVKEILIAALERIEGRPSNREIKLFPRDVEALLSVKGAFEQQLDEIPSLKQLCRLSGLNEDKLKRGFKKLFGTTPYDYHIQLKMLEAKRLLLDTDKTIYEIAYTIGYHHVSNFCIEFKKLFGCQPGFFRKYGRKKN